MKSLTKIRALARDEKTFYERRNVDVDPALAPLVRRIFNELKGSGIAKVEGFWSREKALKWGEDLSQECQGRAEGRSAETIKAGRTLTVAEAIQVRAGGTRWNGVEKEYPALLPEFGEHPLVRAVATLYWGRCQVERLAFQESFPDESLDRMLSEGKRYEVGLGRGWHVDTWAHSLKAFVSVVGCRRGERPIPSCFWLASTRFFLGQPLISAHVMVGAASRSAGPVPSVFRRGPITNHRRTE